MNCRGEDRHALERLPAQTSARSPLSPSLAYSDSLGGPAHTHAHGTQHAHPHHPHPQQASLALQPNSPQHHYHSHHHVRHPDVPPADIAARSCNNARVNSGVSSEEHAARHQPRLFCKGHETEAEEAEESRGAETVSAHGSKRQSSQADGHG